MEKEENILIDTLIFNKWLEVDYQKIVWMFDCYHEQSCCESHYLDFSDFQSCFQEVERKFNKIEKIEIKWTPWMWITLFFYENKDEENERVWIFIPWRWYNNWYYSDELILIVTLEDWTNKKYNISEYQDIE